MTLTAPRPVPPRSKLEERISRLLGEIDQLLLTNAELRAALARETARNDALADLLSGWTDVDCSGGCGRRLATRAPHLRVMCTVCHPEPLPIDPSRPAVTA